MSFSISKFSKDVKKMRQKISQCQLDHHYHLFLLYQNVLAPVTNTYVFRENTTFTLPAGAKSGFIELYGGGGGGAGSFSFDMTYTSEILNLFGGGGGGGGCYVKIPLVYLEGIYIINIGDGGEGGSSGYNLQLNPAKQQTNGDDGEETSVLYYTGKTLATAPGGKGGNIQFSNKILDTNFTLFGNTSGGDSNIQPTTIVPPIAYYSYGGGAGGIAYSYDTTAVQSGGIGLVSNGNGGNGLGFVPTAEQHTNPYGLMGGNGTPYAYPVNGGDGGGGGGCGQYKGPQGGQKYDGQPNYISHNGFNGVGYGCGGGGGAAAPKLVSTDNFLPGGDGGNGADGAIVFTITF